jgi:hypothetical protein
MNKLVQRFGEYKDWALLAQAQTGRGLLSQLRDIHALRKTGGQCGISDYYWYKLYDQGYQEGRGAEDFIGWRLHQQFSLALNPRYAVLPGWDKLVFTLMAGEAGLPAAPVRACFHRSHRLSSLLGLHLKSREAVGAFLRDPSIYPLFGKPVFSQQGHGTAYLAGYDSASDSLQQLNGTSIPVGEFLNRLEQTVDFRFHKPECGYLFQEPFALAPEIRAITNWSAICGVRIICLNGPDGVVPISAGWKIAVPPNQVDNFSGGKYGNLSAQVDLVTGEVGRVVNGFWPKTEVLINHPLTGHALKGFRLPGWAQLLEACHAAGPVFPLMKIHHWDFALTDKGPIMLELNDLGGIDIDQVYGRGLLTGQTRDFLKRYGDSKAYPWIKGL